MSSGYIYLDEVQARLLLKLITGESLVSAEKRELIEVAKQLNDPKFKEREWKEDLPEYY